MVSIGVMSIFGSVYLMNILRDSVVEGARFAAMADQSTISGCERARFLISKALGSSVFVEVGCDPIVHQGSEYERVSAKLPWTIFGVLPVSNVLSTESTAPRELQ